MCVLSPYLRQLQKYSDKDERLKITTLEKPQEEEAHNSSPGNAGVSFRICEMLTLQSVSIFTAIERHIIISVAFFSKTFMGLFKK